ncbi:MAG: FAD-dependent oxidoreductase [Deltaproteobacteria bacterium]|nr:FAD-dependent oxidoreductase [Deltaproteobacteria bacterium]
MKTRGKVIVIGAGMAGLTAAHFLVEAGNEVVVLEQDSRPGGRIQSIERNGDTLDVGAQFIHTNYALTLELTRKFNLESDLAKMQSSDMMLRDGHFHIIPWGSVRVPAISLWSQIKMTRMFLPMLLRKKHMGLEGWPGLLDMDKLELSTFARLKLNEECLDYMVRALMLTYSMSEPEGISLAYFMRSLHMYVTTGAHCFRSGNDVLPRAMARNLDVRYDTTVEAILGNDVVRGVRTSRGEIEAAGVISAVPSPALLPLYANWNADQRAFLEQFAYSKMPLVLYEGELPAAVNYWGGVFDRKAGHRVSFITFPHMKYERASKARYLLAWPLGSLGAELIDSPEATVMQNVTTELRRAMPVEAASLEPSCVVRHPHTYPQYRLGMFEMLLRFKAAEGKPSGLYFAGDYNDGGLIEGAAQSGYRAARRLMAS